MQKGFEVVNLHGTASGMIAVPVIGENGNWWIGNEDTGIKAQGEPGEPGPQGEKGEAGVPGVDPAELAALKTEIEAIKNDLTVINANISGDVLWTNPSPTSSFAAQTLIDVDITDYKSFDVEYAVATNDLGRVLHTKITRDTYDASSTNMRWIQFPANRYTVIFCRSVYIVDGEIRFGDAVSRNAVDSSSSGSNGWIIPILVRGYKHY